MKHEIVRIRVNSRNTIIVILAALTASLALADGFTTINGREYKNATVSRVEPDRLVITFHGGIVKIPFTELPREARERFNYDPEAAMIFARMDFVNVHR